MGQIMFDKLIDWLKKFGESFSENGTSYALFIGSFIGLLYFNNTLIHLGTPGSEFRLSESVKVPWTLLNGIGLLLYKNWILKLIGVMLMFMAIQELAYILASLSILGKYA